MSLWLEEQRECVAEEKIDEAVWSCPALVDSRVLGNDRLNGPSPLVGGGSARVAVVPALEGSANVDIGATRVARLQRFQGEIDPAPCLAHLTQADLPPWCGA